MKLVPLVDRENAQFRRGPVASNALMTGLSGHSCERIAQGGQPFRER